ncbi:MAG: hypothetical protein A2V81_05055 [Candidatus Abawacabacteria bacterium RBG_16_42_10]|uniref:Pyruvate kinase n=1 Tax=Candidatus Abawacabacteria bacterium RBG_16_42_10 TaxID=1817814 RepID=A0A1F4XKJ9_9BACT|nr:MAG: hypothetical protein A2V81_05055 [Candidatus Abawacabacteria bacterium RBG_16_42_10]
MLDFIVTIGPATKGLPMMQALAEKGATVFRLNFSHNNYDWYDNLFDDLQEVKKLHPHLKILADISGPSLRIQTPEQKDVVVKKGDTVNFPVTLPEAIPQLPKGTIIIFGEGNGTMEVVDNKETLTLKSHNSFTLTDKMHMHTKVHLQLPALTEKDWEDVHYLLDKPIDILALSFIQDEKPILAVRDFINSKNKQWQIMSKIETQAAMNNLDSIVQESDLVMVARGDLALEAELTELPANQEKIIQVSKQYGKPVIVATQLLYSMINNPMPSRAEINDIAQAVKQGATGLLLSDETTIGKYPLAALRYLKTIAEKYQK